MKQWVTSLLVCVCLGACSYIDVLTKDGVEITREIQVENFNAIEVMAALDIHLIPDDTFKCVVKGADFLVKDFFINQEGEKLILDHHNSFFLREEQLLEISLHAPNINVVTLNAAIHLTNADTIKNERFQLVVNSRGAFSESNLLLDCQQVSISVYGENVGHHLFKGHAGSLQVNLEGLADFNGDGLIVDKVGVNHKSLSNCHVFSQGTLTANMYSSGNVYYKGNPEVTVTRYDRGWGIKLGDVIPWKE